MHSTLNGLMFCELISWVWWYGCDSVALKSSELIELIELYGLSGLDALDGLDGLDWSDSLSSMKFNDEKMHEILFRIL